MNTNMLGAGSFVINMNINDLPVQWKFASAGPEFSK